jgi:hypothetical protein
MPFFVARKRLTRRIKTVREDFAAIIKFKIFDVKMKFCPIKTPLISMLSAA